MNVCMTIIAVYNTVFIFADSTYYMWVGGLPPVKSDNSLGLAQQASVSVQMQQYILQ